MDWGKGSYAELDNFTLNDNEKTFDLTKAPMFISQFHVKIENTATIGDRRFLFFSYDSTENGDSYMYYNGNHSANQNTLIHFGDGSYNDTDLSGDLHNDIQLPKFWSEDTPYWNKIKVKDNLDVDSNDDWYVIFRGVYAVPKYHWIELKNCEKLQFNVIPDSRGDVIGALDLDFTPVSLRVIKI